MTYKCIDLTITNIVLPTTDVLQRKPVSKSLL